MVPSLPILSSESSVSVKKTLIGKKNWLLWVYRSLENAFAAIADLKILGDTDAHPKLQPQSSCTFMQISLYFANPKLYSILTFTLRMVSKFPTIIVMISHLKKCLCAYKKGHCSMYEINVKFQSLVRH